MGHVDIFSDLSATNLSQICVNNSKYQYMYLFHVATFSLTVTVRFSTFHLLKNLETKKSILLISNNNSRNIDYGLESDKYIIERPSPLTSCPLGPHFSPHHWPRLPPLRGLEGEERPLAAGRSALRPIFMVRSCRAADRRAWRSERRVSARCSRCSGPNFERVRLKCSRGASLTRLALSSI